jgi:uncharacterized protein
MTKRSWPVIDEYSAPYWDGAAKGQLTVQKCDDCAAIVFPPYPECLECGCSDTTWLPMRGIGTVHSLGVVEDSILPGLEDLLPLRCALVELDEGPSAILPTNIFAETGEHVAVGTRVRVDFELTGDVHLPVFRPYTDQHDHGQLVDQA